MTSTSHMTISLKMDKGRNHKTERILHLTLDIIYLLTGEDYVVVKKTFIRELTRNQTPVTASPSYSMTAERNTEEKILEVINKITEVLTGEKNDSLGELKDLRTDVSTKNLHSITLLDLLTGGSHPPMSPLQHCMNMGEGIVIEQSTTKSSSPQEHDIARIQGKVTSSSCVGEPLRCSGISISRGITQNASSHFNNEHGPPSDLSVSTDSSQYQRIKIKEEQEDHLDIDISNSTQMASIRLEKASPGGGLHFQADSPAVLDYITTTIKRESWEEGILSGSDESHTPTDHLPYTDNLVLTVTGQTPSVEKPYSCLECGKCYSSTKSLSKHTRLHTGVNVNFCAECGKTFFNKSGLIKHQRIHSGEKPFACLECGKCFISKFEIEMHQRSHTGEKPYSCSECGRSFSTKSNLVKHTRVHTGEKPYTCLECQKSFSINSDLVRHVRTHTGERPYSCSDCGRRFISKSNLTRHQVVHSGIRERPYSCSMCRRCFTSNSDLGRHQRVHAGEKPFTCDKCGKGFSSKTALSAHVRRATRGEDLEEPPCLSED
ncbi:zinc finger protein 629-like [Hyperolius riggenbachi]|uniref:zinc finger protein 629-like n=1 Tax=Hyperolius riggenbachi TaxID=752182 RepID=UPI0035A38FD9